MSSKSVEAEAQVHLLAIRNALANRNAAVMVGAGFSRNAEGGENLATWAQLSEALARELQPGSRTENFTPSAASQLAEQYARVFSPTHLEQLIKRCVPDDQVSPGPLHTKLLELPWSEVFTTNYDTLLERAAERMFEVSYFPVCSRADIPQSKILGRRRIVKLHGSFPSHRPFILTEEEYRTYPEQFAPFVNLVRQSLLENVFCLIGFSGDDPNFLHWIGWVRDMLDKHALPVYLFLANEPTLGERKLYEARGVIPVVLPTPKGVRQNDYQARYRELFKELEKPLLGSPLDWGDYPSPQSVHHDSRDESAFSKFMNELPALIAYRSTYPGWIVAPKEVRQRFRQLAQWLENALEAKHLSDQLAKCPAPLILSVIDLYCWMQQVMLAPLFDGIAELGYQALIDDEQSNSQALSENVAQFFTLMHCQDGAVQRGTRTRAALSLLTWARQSHHTAAYTEIRQHIQPIAQQDTAVNDHLIYEDILYCLQCADRPKALQLLMNWRPKSTSAYAHVLRGALMAELTDAAAAMPILGHAIQTLRRQQRSRPRDPALISQEAWACLVAHHMQQAEEFILKWHGSSQGSQKASDQVEEPEREREDFDGRVNALIARGYSAKEELNTFLAKLNAEAQLPAASVRRFAGFNLGTVSSHRAFGASSELREKISASFAWLELFERVGLPPRTGSAAFYTEQMLQAAWWARFADTPERSIGLLLRSNRRNALKPRDRSTAPHKTGWLERHEVAKLHEKAAENLSQELMQQLVAEFEVASPADPSGERAAFLLEAFGRLAIRVQDQALLQKLGQQLLGLHRTSAFQEKPLLWDNASEALGRILEVLSSNAQGSMLLDIFRLPLEPVSVNNTPIREHELNHWVNLQKVCRSCKPTIFNSAENEWRNIVADLIHLLQTPGKEKPKTKVWSYLETMRSLELLTESEKNKVGEILWLNVAVGDWPSIPNYYPVATLLWPAPSRNPASQLLDRLISKPLRPFSSGGHMQLGLKNGRKYSLGAEFVTFGQIYATVNRCTASLQQMNTLTHQIEEWLDIQLKDLIEDLQEDQLHDSIASVVTYVDQILGKCLTDLINRKRTLRSEEIIHRIALINDRLQPLQFVRLNTGLNLVIHGERDISFITSEIQLLVQKLASNDSQKLIRSCRMALLLLESSAEILYELGRIIFDTVVACILSERTSCLSNSLLLLSNLSQSAWKRYLNERTLLQIDAALNNLASALSYERPSSDVSIPDEEVPLIRFRTMQLAHQLINTADADSDAARQWLERAKDDPLPEIRLGQYKNSQE